MSVQTKPCPGGYSEMDKVHLPCRSILPFPRGFKGSWVDACPGKCNGKGIVPVEVMNENPSNT